MNLSLLKFGVMGVSGYGVDDGVEVPATETGVGEALAEACS